jgi:GntR family transcriptional regulator/MocR family aminotransferase
MPKISHNISIAGLNIDRESKIPLTKQLYEGIRMAILNKQIRPGQRLPSSRTLAEDIGLSRNIVLLAYEQLTLEGYLTGSVGNGSFVSADAHKAFTEFTSAKKKASSESADTEQKMDFNPGYEVSALYADRESIKGSS